ncbi:MAG TPA: peptidase C69, partial [Thermosipho africanus]|nr:peptidase C69 [Thermosipho africanus]
MLNQSLIKDIIGTVLKYGGDFAEVFVENKYENRIELTDGKIQKANTNNISGVGIRGFLGKKG